MDLISRVFPTRPPAPKENPNNKAKEGKFRRSQTCFSLGCGDFNASVYIYPTPPVCALIMSRFFLYSNYTLIELEKKNVFQSSFQNKTEDSFKWYTLCKQSSPSSFTVSLAVVSGTCGQPRFKTTTWKIPEINNRYHLSLVPFWIAWWNLVMSCSIPPGLRLIPLSSVFTRRRSSLISHLATILVVRWIGEVWCGLCSSHSPLFYLIMNPKCKTSDAGNLDMPEKSCELLPWGEQVKVLDLIR